MPAYVDYMSKCGDLELNQNFNDYNWCYSYFVKVKKYWPQTICYHLNFVFRFALKNNLPLLEYVTLPRTGALEAILNVLGPHAGSVDLSLVDDLAGQGKILFPSCESWGYYFRYKADTSQLGIFNVIHNIAGGLRWRLRATYISNNGKIGPFLKKNNGKTYT